MRNVSAVYSSDAVRVGPLHVAQPLPNEILQYADPFVLLHHAGPQHFEANKETHRISPHPHRGFSPVTFVYQGEIHHKDSLGNEGFIGPGEVQWMNSGKGLLHSEGPSAEFLKTGGTLELVQLWVNTPRVHKMDAPQYIEASAATIPLIEQDGVQIRVVAGSVENVRGPVEPFSPLTALMVHMHAERNYHWITDEITALVYVLGGTIKIGDTVVEEKHLAVLGSGAHVEIASTTSSRLLLLSGQPINEPIATGGPFVMNTRLEVFQAFQDAQSGMFGELRD